MHFVECCAFTHYSLLSQPAQYLPEARIFEDLVDAERRLDTLIESHLAEVKESLFRPARVRLPSPVACIAFLYSAVSLVLRLCVLALCPRR